LDNFAFNQNSQINVANGGFVCLNNTGSSNNISRPDDYQNFLNLAPEYKLGVNPPGLPEYNGATCTTPCSYMTKGGASCSFNATIDYATGPNFDVLVNPKVSYCNRYRWKVERVQPGGVLSEITNQTFNGTPVSVKLNTLLNLNFNSCTQYKLTLSIACNQTDFISSSEQIISTNPIVEAGNDLEICNNINTYQLTEFTPQNGKWSSLNATVSEAGLIQVGSITPGIPVEFKLTYTDAYGCTSTDTRNVTVNPVPAQPIISSNSPVCEKQTLILQTSAVSGAEYIWSGPSGVVGVRNYNGISIPDVSTTSSGNYTVKLKVNGCESVSSLPVSVTINPLPVVSAGTAQSVCLGTAAFDISGGSPVNGKWTGTGVTLNKTFTPSTAGIGNHTLTYTYINANSCSKSAEKVITVGPLINTGGILEVCKNSSPVTITGVTPAGGTFSGTGISNPSGIFDPANLTPGTYDINYNVTSGGCNGNAIKKVLVKAAPSPLSVTSNSPVCGGDVITLNATIFTGATYEWTNSGGGKSYSSSLVIPTDKVTPFSGSFSVIANLNGCTATATKAVSSTIPVVSAGSAQTVCRNGAAITITGGTPAGGTWSGTGVLNGTFNPSGLVSGQYRVTYKITDATSGCSSEASKFITVGPVADAGLPLSACANETSLTLSGGTPSGGTWSGTGVTSGVFNPSAVTPGDNYVAYTYVSGSCTTSVNKLIRVREVPSVPDISVAPPTCSGGNIKLTGGTPVAGVTYTWTGPNSFSFSSFTPNIFVPVTTGAGTYTLKTYKSGCGGTASKTVNAVINPLPVTGAITGTSVVCRQQKNVIYSVPATSGSTYNWTVPVGATINSGQNTNQINVTFKEDGGNITVSETNSNGCVGLPVSFSVSFSALPAGANMSSPVEVGKLSSCGTMVYAPVTQFSTLDNSCYGNYYTSGNSAQPNGRATNDVFFRFELGYDSDVEINTCGSSIDSYLHLLKEDGTWLASDDDNNFCGSGSLHAYLRRNLSKGKYFVVIEGWGSNGDIKLSIKNNTSAAGISRSTAIDLGTLANCLNKSVTGTNSSAACFTNSFTGSSQASPEAYYKFTLSQASTVNISMCAAWDTYMHLLDAAGGLLQSDDDGNNCGYGTSRISTGLAAGTYYIVCEGYGSNSGDFNLDVKATDGNVLGGKLTNPIIIGDMTGCNKSFADTKNTGGNNCFANNYTSSSGGQNSNDVIYQFTVTGSSDIEISMCSQDYDTYLSLLNSSYSRIVSDDDNTTGCSGSTYGSYIRQTLTAGTYYIVCEGFGIKTGNYNLQVKNLQTGCTSTCSRTYVSNTSMPATLGAFGSTTTYTGGAIFKGTYRVAGNIILKEGTYILNSDAQFYVDKGLTITLGKNAKLELNGAIVTKSCTDPWEGIVLDVDDPGVQGVEIVSSNNTVISHGHFGIKTNITNYLNQPQLIEGQNSPRLKVNITNTQFLNNFYGIRLDAVVSYWPSNIISGNTFSGDYFSWGSWSGTAEALQIRFTGLATETYTISNNIFNNGSELVIDGTSTNNNITVSGNEIYSRSLGMKFSGNRNLVVINNKIYSRNDASSYWGMTIADCHSSRFENNTISYCRNIGANIGSVSLYGMQVSNTTGLTARNNRIENFDIGISITGGKSTISKNNIINSVKAIEIAGVTNNNNISILCNTISNSSLNSSSQGIYLSSSTAVTQLGSTTTGCGNRFANIGKPVVNDGNHTGSNLSYYKYNLTEDNGVISGTKGGTLVPVSVSSGTTLDQLCSNTAIKESIEGLSSEPSSDMNLLDVSEVNGAYLGQNVPNPATSQSEISYIVPAMSESAQIRVFDVYRGNEIESFEITTAGRGTINVDLSKYATGTYIYTLYINDMPFDNKKMVIVK
jgi:hypothetical protein